jgi:hypothetical protein
VQTNGNECKQNEAKLLPFALVYFSESGLFKGLRAKKYKKIPARVSGCVQNVSDGCLSPSSSRLPGETRVRSAVEFVITKDDSLGF